MHKFRRISFNICHVSFSSFFSSIFYQKLLKTCQILANYSCLAPSKFTDFLKIGKGNVPIKFFEHRILMSLFFLFSLVNLRAQFRIKSFYVFFLLLLHFGWQIMVPMQSHYIEVVQGAIFMEQNMIFGLILDRLAILKKKLGGL